LNVYVEGRKETGLNKNRACRIKERANSENTNTSRRGRKLKLEKYRYMDNQFQVWSFHCADLRDYSILGCDIVSIGKYLPILWGNVLPTYSA